MEKLTQEELEILDNFAAENNLDKNEDGSEVEKTADYYKMLAEKAEAQFKEGDNEDEKEKLLTYNMQKRALKALTKANSDNKSEEEVKVEANSDLLTYETLSRDDWDALRRAGYKEKDKETEYILKALNGGLVNSVSEALQDVGIKAKLEAFKAEADTANVIDEDNDGFFEKTLSEAKQEFDTTGAIPDDDKLQEKLVDEVVDEIRKIA